MRIITVIACFSVILMSVNAQTILAEKEILSTIQVGDMKNEIQYNSNDEGFFSPTGPLVDNKGSLLFFPLAGNNARKYLLQYTSKIWSRVPLFPVMSGRGWGSNVYQFSSQQGMINVLGNFQIFFPIQDSFEIIPFSILKNVPESYEVFTNPLPNGSLIESYNPKYLFSTEISKNRQIIARNLEETRIWLLTQPGGFSIGADGLLYRNGVLWSARPPIGGTYAEKYIGRLISGHQVWIGGGIPGWERYLTITNSVQQIELILDIPWAPKDNGSEDGYNPFNYGLGPWGELYALIAPYWDQKTAWNPKDGDTSELVVVRNHLKYFGRLNDSNVRMRKEPNTSSDILGTYSAKTGFRIIEKGTKEETIGGQKNFWYKVRLLDGKEGWFFGAFVHNLYDGPNGLPPPWPNEADW